MPSFSWQCQDIQQAGPLAQIQIAVGAAVEQLLISQGQPIPPPVSAIAMIDTGASGSVIQAGLLAPLGLHPVGVTNIHTPSSVNVPCNEYLVRIVFPNNVVIQTTAIEAPLAGQHIQALIGRDVLAQGVLIYIGYTNSYTLSF